MIENQGAIEYFVLKALHSGLTIPQILEQAGIQWKDVEAMKVSNPPFVKKLATAMKQGIITRREIRRLENLVRYRGVTLPPDKQKLIDQRDKMFLFFPRSPAG